VAASYQSPAAQTTALSFFCPELKGKGKYGITLSQSDDLMGVVVFRNKPGAKTLSQLANLIDVKIIDEIPNHLRRNVLARSYAMSGQLIKNRFSVFECHQDVASSPGLQTLDSRFQTIQ
jgi:hypothetical protein